MVARALPDRRVGVDIGGTKVLGVLVEGGQVLARSRVATPGMVGPEPAGAGRRDVAGEVVRAVAELVDRLGGERLPLGVGAPGMVDRQGCVRFAPNLPGLTGVDLAGRLSEHFGRPEIVVGNDASCAAHAEHVLGAGRGSHELVMITLGTGIGGGLVVDGALRTGRHGFAGEIGHMVVDPSGPPCPCGGRGCWERYASGGGLGRMARDAAAAGLLPGVLALAGGDAEAVRGEHVTDAARHGDAGARGVLEEAGWWLALGLANLTAALDPERIVVGGGLVTAGEALLEPARRAFGDLVQGGARRPAVEIVAAALGEEAGAVGAALLAGPAPRTGRPR